MTLSSFLKALARRKQDDDEEESKLDRCLSLLDLTALGVGGTLGLGVYVLAGAVAKTVAGPAVCISFLIAAVASAVAGVCYAEFAARVPKAGSAYVYSYVSVGEFIAYIIGWNLILEYVIGTASVARGLSNYIDALADQKISEAFRDWMPMDIDFISAYPDFLAFVLVMILTGILAFGVKESSILNNIFTVLNLLTVAIVLVSGSIKADSANWTLPKSKVPPGYGEGGFMPYGISGVMQGAAKCFYGFVGFDAVATTGEEAKNPQKNIPLAIVFSLLVIFLAYFGISTVLTLMIPYYDQDADAPFPYAFHSIGWDTIKWIVTTGAIFALCTSLLGAMFPLPRVLYAMSKDGLLFQPLSKVNQKTQTPLMSTILSGLFAATMATLFDLNQLIDMMSIGTLLAYTIVAICVLILRYKPDGSSNEHKTNEHKTNDSSLFRLLFNLDQNHSPTSKSSLITNVTIAIFSVFTGLMCAILINQTSQIADLPYITVLFTLTCIGMLICFTIIIRQPVQDVQLSFKVPLVPLVPCLSILFNLYLMLELDLQTWIRFVVWLIIGFLIYFFYGIWNSQARFPKGGNTDRQAKGGNTAIGCNNADAEKQVTKF